jgi:trans-2,3-dihydro-3-hydroxyanthranilate isomerase
MRYRYLTCDVFTDRRFGGNQLAVVPDAEGLDTSRMQRLAAEFNYSETTFVLPPRDPANLARVRIFTPRAEMPFAGHPTVGTALALGWLGRLPPAGGFVFEMEAGLVPVTVGDGTGGAPRAEFAAPRRPWSGPALAPGAVAGALGLEPGDLVADNGLPCAASCGAPFLIVELAGLASLARARVATTAGLPEVAAEGVFLFTRDGADGEAELRARMFAPAHGIPEDPATGSAAAALAGFLAGRPGLADGWHAWRIAQGVEMGRPSQIATRARREAGEVVDVRVAGGAVPVAEGTVEADG